MLKKFLIPLFILGVIVYWRWFFLFSILSHGDWGFFYQETQRKFLNFPFGWTSDGFGSVAIAILPMYPVNILWGILADTNFAISERLIYFFPSVLFSIFGAFFLSRRILESNVGAMIAAVVFTFNTYFLLGRTGHLTLMTAFAFAPLAMFLFIKAIEEKRLNLAVTCGLLFFIVSSYETRAFYVLAWVCFFYFLYYSIFISESFSKKSFAKNAFFAFIPIFLVVLLNFYWVFGFLKIGVVTDNVFFDRGLFGDAFMNIEQALALFHPFWTGGEIAVFKVQPIPFYFFFIPLFAFLGLWLNRENKRVVFFGFIALLGILLTKQSGAPFERLYLWLYNNLPGFNAFREASKFYFVIALGYAILIGSLVSYLWDNWKYGKWQVYGRNILTGVIVLLFLWNTKPLITGEIGTLFVSRHIPNDYIITKDFISQQSEYFRTLWIPSWSRWSFYADNHPRVSGINSIQFNWDKFVGYNQQGTNFPIQDQVVEVLKQSFSDSLIDVSAIKYVIVPIRDTGNDDDFFGYYGDRKFFIDELDKINYLQRIDIGTKDIVVFENRDYRPHIYQTKEKETIYEKLPFEKVDFQFKNPTEHHVFLKSVSSPIFLNFSEKYHPDWSMRIGNFNWIDVLMQDNYFIADKYHFKNDAQLNSFSIDPAIVCNTSTCIRNSDGSYNIDLTIYFRTQSYLYLGSIISGATLIGCIMYLSFDFFVRRRKLFNEVSDESEDLS